MPPKKRDKDKDAEAGKNSKADASNDDHEQFLQAFEKPTQIYRYLRTRNMLKPVFLYRTLTYMRHRMSRSHKSRRGFKVDSLLQTVTSRLHQQEPISGFLTLTFLGFYNKSSGLSQEEPVKVETLLLKICHKKRKDVSCPVMTVSLGTSYVPYNPSEEFPPPKAPTVSIPTESFSLSGHLVKSYHLLLRVATMTSNILSINSDLDLEPAHKKRKSIKGCGGGGGIGGSALNGNSGGMSDEEKLVQFGTDLVIYDKQNRCLLSDGEYEFYLEEIHGTNSGSKIAHALSTWEEIGFDKELKEQHLSSFDKMSNGPALKVRLQWSRDAVTPMVDRPLPLLPVDKNDLSNKENNRPESGNKLRDRPSVVYQFLYNNNSKQQTEASCDMHCPWCSIDCKTLYSLLKHLKLCHPRFSFTYVPTQSGARIDVSLNEGYDGSYSGAPGGGGSMGRGGGPVRRTPLSHVIVCHPRRPHPALTEFLHLDENEFDAQRPYITGHNRLYHHTTTCLPIYPKEMDIDSEDETDPRWLQKKTMMMIDEFTDVNEGEKELMKMWNLHVMRHGFVGDCQIALACTMFLQQRGEQLLSNNLYRNFVLHMCNLFDFGLISPVTVYTTVQKLQEMIGVEDTKVLKESVLSQREAWKDGCKQTVRTGGAQSQASPAPGGGIGGGGAGVVPGSDTGQRRKPGAVYSDHKKNQHRRSPSPHQHGGEQSGGVAKKRKMEPQQQQPSARRRLSLPATSGRPQLRRKQAQAQPNHPPPRRRSSFTNLASNNNPLPPPLPSDHHPPSKKKAESILPPPPLHAPSPLAVNH